MLGSTSGPGVRMKGWSLIFGLILSSCALAQEASPVLGGSWTATAGPNQIFRGTWSAQTLLHNPNAARGSWTLLNEAGEVLLEGTWSAQKTGQRWQGTWTARPGKGQALSGTWTADATNLKCRNLRRDAEQDGNEGGLWLVAKRPLPRQLVAEGFTTAGLQIVGLKQRAVTGAFEGDPDGPF